MKVEKNIPIPNKFPFAQMEVGDSFVVAAHIKTSTLYMAARRFGEKNGMKFSIRNLPDNTRRCWRTK